VVYILSPAGELDIVNEEIIVSEAGESFFYPSLPCQTCSQPGEAGLTATVKLQSQEV